MFNLAGLRCGNMFVAAGVKRAEILRTIERNYNTQVWGWWRPRPPLHTAVLADFHAGPCGSEPKALLLSVINNLDKGIKVLRMDCSTWLDRLGAWHASRRTRRFHANEVSGMAALEGPKFGFEVTGSCVCSARSFSGGSSSIALRALSNNAERLGWISDGRSLCHGVMSLKFSSREFYEHPDCRVAIAGLEVQGVERVSRRWSILRQYCCSLPVQVTLRHIGGQACGYLRDQVRSQQAPN